MGVGVMPDKVEYRAVIRFLHLQGKSAQIIHEEMSAVYGPWVKAGYIYMILRLKK